MLHFLRFFLINPLFPTFLCIIHNYHVSIISQWINANRSIFFFYKIRLHKCIHFFLQLKTYIVGTRSIRLIDVILTCTFNLCFKENKEKNITFCNFRSIKTAICRIGMQLVCIAFLNHRLWVRRSQKLLLI